MFCIVRLAEKPNQRCEDRKKVRETRQREKTGEGAPLLHERILFFLDRGHALGEARRKERREQGLKRDTGDLQGDPERC